MSIADQTLAILAEVTETERVRSEPNLPLFEEGLLDSLGTVTLMARLSEELNLDISPAEFDREAWSTPARLAADMQRRVGS